MLISPGTVHVEQHSEEWRILDPDAHLLSGSHKIKVFPFLAQNRRKQPHEFGTDNGRALMKPSPVPGNANIDLAAMRRSPCLDWWKLAACCKFALQARQT